MTDHSRTRTFFDVLALPARFLRSLTEDENARVRVDRDAYVLELDLPGFDADAFDVSWDDGSLSVVAADSEESYEESFPFPAVVRPDDIRATYDVDAGVLTVVLPVSGRRARIGAAPRDAGDASSERGAAD